MLTYYNSILKPLLIKHGVNEDVQFLAECFDHKTARKKFRKGFSELYGGESKAFYIIYRSNDEVLDIQGFDDAAEFDGACKALTIW